MNTFTDEAIKVLMNAPIAPPEVGRVTALLDDIRRHLPHGVSIDHTYDPDLHNLVITLDPVAVSESGRLVQPTVEATALVRIEASGNPEVMIEEIPDMEGILFPYGITHREGVLDADLVEYNTETYSVTFPVSLVIEVGVACMTSDGRLTAQEQERVESLAADEIDLPNNVYVDRATLNSVEID